MNTVAFCKLPCGCIIKPSEHFLLPLMFRMEDCQLVHQMQWDENGAPYLTQPVTMGNVSEFTVSIKADQEDT